jgi:hypothetical protein
MQEHGVGSFDELQAFFEGRLVAMLDAAHRTPIIWEETFQTVGHVFNASSAVVEVWSNFTVLQQALSAGFDVILADGWYLDRQVGDCFQLYISTSTSTSTTQPPHPHPPTHAESH